MRLAAIAALALAALLWGWSPSGPTYHATVDGGNETYPCRGGDEPLPVRFSADGLVAEVSFRGQTRRLPFVGNGLLEDVYAANGWKLTLDPEANWYGPNGLHLVCVW